jgi:hypothetical protein
MRDVRRRSSARRPANSTGLDCRRRRRWTPCLPHSPVLGLKRPLGGPPRTQEKPVVDTIALPRHSSFARAAGPSSTPPPPKTARCRAHGPVRVGPLGGRGQVLSSRVRQSRRSIRIPTRRRGVEAVRWNSRVPGCRDEPCLRHRRPSPASLVTGRWWGVVDSAAGPRAGSRSRVRSAESERDFRDLRRRAPGWSPPGRGHSGNGCSRTRWVCGYTWTAR